MNKLFTAILLIQMFVAPNIQVHAQQSKEEIQNQIESLQKELDKFDKEENEDSNVTIGLIKTENSIFDIKEAYVFEDEDAASGKAILFIMDYTNKGEKSREPSSAVIWELKAEQESDIQVFDLGRSSGLKSRKELDAVKNRQISLKPGATITIEYSYEIELESSPVIIKTSSLTESTSDPIVVNPADLTLINE